MQVQYMIQQTNLVYYLAFKFATNDCCDVARVVAEEPANSSSSSRSSSDSRAGSSTLWQQSGLEATSVEKRRLDVENTSAHSRATVR